MNHVSTCAGLKNIHNSEISNPLQWNLDYTAVESQIDNQRVYERTRISRWFRYPFVPDHQGREQADAARV